jgi:hypothetical protein
VVSVNVDGSFTYTPHAEYSGEDQFSYKLAAGNGTGALESNVGSVSLTITPVNDAPVAVDAQRSTLEDGGLDLDLLALAGDVDSSALSARIVSAPAHGALTLDSGGVVRYTPLADFFGTDAFTFSVSDGELDSSPARVRISVTPVNDAPLASEAQRSVPEDGVLEVDLLALASDVDSGELSAQIVSAPAHGALSLGTDGRVRYTPVADFFGADAFTFHVSDGELTSPAALIAITVAPLNDAPIAASVDASTAEDRPLTLDLLALASDADGDALTLSLSSAPHHGSVLLNPDGTLTYAPGPNYFGADGFTYIVNDGQRDSTLAQVRLSVAPVNDAPVALDFALSTTEDTPVSVDLLANVSDVEGDPLSLAIVDAPEHGELRRNADGSFTYTPSLDFFGTDRITYRANDGSADPAVATVALSVSALNDAPRAREISLVTAEDTPLAIDLRAQVSDADSANVSIEIVGMPAHGALTRNADGTFAYAPSLDFFGADSFTYRANDGLADSGIATVTISVTPVNDAPVAQDLAFSVDQNATLVAQLAASDVERDPLVYELSGAPEHGLLELGPDGAFRYTPAAGYAGTDAFSYRAFDGRSWSVPAAVALSVRSLNQAPQFVSVPPTQFLLTTLRSGSARDSVFEVQGTLGQSVRVSFDWIARQAAYNNELGLYAVDDALGRVNGLDPDDPGYAAAALAAGNAQVLFTSGQGSAAHTELTLTGGRQYAFYLIQNDTRAHFLARNAQNQLGCGPLAFFSIPDANPDAVDHLRAAFDASGKLTLAWEDLTGGGDRDFDDAIVRATGFTAIQPDLFRYRAQAEDRDGDALSYRLLQGPAGTTLDALTGELRFAPALPGRYNFALEVLDGKGGRATQEFTLEVQRARRLLRVRGSDCADDIAIAEQDGITRVSIDGHTRAYSALDGIVAEGLAGDDCLRLSGLTVDTLIDAGAGDDRVDGSQVNGARLIIYAGLGNDRVKSGAGDDYVDAGAGNDTLEGNAGDDVLIGGAGDDTVKGGAGDDILVKASGSDWLDGGAGDDTIISPNQLPGQTEPMPIIDWAAALPPADSRTRASWVVEFVSSGAQVDPNAAMVVRI